MSKNFFADLPAVSEHLQMIEQVHYFDLPQDWWILLTDVKGSTKAIEAGRYKEVNMVGVSCIVAVQNALAEQEFPFIFGGDGATIAVPSEFSAVAMQALSHTRKTARSQFDLELRIAAIPVAKILSTGAALQVGKLRISDGHHLALLRGNGWGIAETWMKERESEFELPSEYPSGGDHDGLECRWNPLKSRRSEMMALIVQARRQDNEAMKIYRDILTEILATDSKPIALQNLRAAWPPKHLWQEARMRVPGLLSRLVYLAKAYTWLLLVALILWSRGKKNLTAPVPYMNELTQNTDYLKFDDCLRMIIDVSVEQKQKLISRLEEHHRRGEIFFGFHCDPVALMTCFVQGPSKHLHFVDAGGGGYAMAAKQLKSQRLRG